MRVPDRLAKQREDWLAGWAAPPRLAHAANLDTTADCVFGQPGFTHNTANNGGVSAHSLAAPECVPPAAQGDPYGPGFENSRAPEYDWALVNVELPIKWHCARPTSSTGSSSSGPDS